MHVRSLRSSGFTLVEILIVVVILGILAAIVVPQFTDTTTAANEATLRAQLKLSRGQIELFRARTGNAPAMVTQQWTPMLAGNYLKSAPENPLNGSTLIAAAPGASPVIGWVWRDKGNGTFALFATDGAATAEFTE